MARLRPKTDEKNGDIIEFLTNPHGTNTNKGAGYGRVRAKEDEIVERKGQLRGAIC